MKPKKEGTTYYSFSGMAKFKGFIKNGLDSSTMINLIVAFDSNSDEFKRKGFTSPPNLFYHHEISRSETIGVLINEFEFTKEEAIEAYNKLVNQFNLSKIKRIASIDNSYEKLVEEANANLVKKENNHGLNIGGPDIIIIGGFLREKISFVHSGDNAFLKTCEILGINTIPMPKKDILKENEIRSLMKSRKNN